VKIKQAASVFALGLGIAFGDTPCIAKLGESVPEMDARYGKPTGILESGPDERRVYRQGDYELDILFVNGTSLRETVHRSGHNHHFSMAECLHWAKAMSDTDNWKLISPNVSNTRWTSGPLLAAKITRTDEASDYFSVYGKGFMSYFMTKQNAQWKAAAVQSSHAEPLAPVHMSSSPGSQSPAITNSSQSN
jgi:hypothetical protein